MRTGLRELTANVSRESIRVSEYLRRKGERVTIASDILHTFLPPKGLINVPSALIPSSHSPLTGQRHQLISRVGIVLKVGNMELLTNGNPYSHIHRVKKCLGSSLRCLVSMVMTQEGLE